MPTPTDMQLGEEIHEVAEGLASFRVEVAAKFGSVNTRLDVFRAEFKEELFDFRADITERFGAVNARREAIRFEIKRNLSDFRADMTEKFRWVNARQDDDGAEFQTNRAFIRWIGTFFAGLLVSVFIGVVTVAGNASGLYSNLQFQNRYLEELRSAVEDHGLRLQKIEGRMDGIEGRMARIEKQLGVLIQRIETKARG